MFLDFRDWCGIFTTKEIATKFSLNKFFFIVGLSSGVQNFLNSNLGKLLVFVDCY